MYNSSPSVAHKLLIEHIVHDYICVHLSSMSCENPESVRYLTQNLPVCTDHFIPPCERIIMISLLLLGCLRGIYIKYYIDLNVH